MKFAIFVNVVLLMVFVDKNNCVQCEATKCTPDCRTVLCPLIKCAPGYISVTPKGQCCKTCQRDCSAIKCPLIRCAPGYLSVIPEGECCNTCQLDCSLVDCRPIKCAASYVSVVPEGQCCPQCQLDCAAAQCLACVGNQVAVTVPDSCCPFAIAITKNSGELHSLSLMMFGTVM